MRLTSVLGVKFIEGFDGKELVLALVVHDAIQLTPYHQVHIFP